MNVIFNNVPGSAGLGDLEAPRRLGFDPICPANAPAGNSRQRAVAPGAAAYPGLASPPGGFGSSGIDLAAGRVAERQSFRAERLVLTWRWRTTADPNRPPGHRIAHPLADRFGQQCLLICQGRNGNRLVEFEDGLRVVAPLYATRTTA